MEHKTIFDIIAELGDEKLNEMVINHFNRKKVEEVKKPAEISVEALEHVYNYVETAKAIARMNNNIPIIIATQTNRGNKEANKRSAEAIDNRFKSLHIMEAEAHARKRDLEKMKKDLEETKAVIKNMFVVDKDMPTHAIYNHNKGVTVVFFEDRTKVLVKSDGETKTNAYTGVLIALAKRYLGYEVSLDNIFDRHSKKRFESFCYGVVLAKFLEKKYVKNETEFDEWFINFISGKVVVNTKEVNK